MNHLIGLSIAFLPSLVFCQIGLTDPEKYTSLSDEAIQASIDANSGTFAERQSMREELKLREFHRNQKERVRQAVSAAKMEIQKIYAEVLEINEDIVGGKVKTKLEELNEFVEQVADDFTIGKTISDLQKIVEAQNIYIKGLEARQSPHCDCEGSRGNRKAARPKTPTFQKPARPVRRKGEKP